MPMFFRSALFALGALFAFGAVAQPGPDEQPGAASDQPDPPSRVARLSYLRGAVSFVPAGENDWVEAQLNRPLITGDKLYTDRDARAELEIGSAALRIDEGTSFDFLNLDDQTAQVELTEGALNLRVRRLYDNQTYEIDTPTLAFVIDRVGEYRVTVEPDGAATIVSVMRGSGDAYGEGGARFRVEEGQSVAFHDSALRDYEDDALPPADAFDRFIAERDSRWDRARSRQYVSEDVIGYEDLDDNGDWDDVPEYGHVWFPTTVDVGWSPYHYGHWGWVGAYGWTWIDDAPWGFAPFHYGRWAHVRGRWGWCPGPIAVRPYYAPALVAFIGGGGVSIGVSVGGPVGWFPLGPRDVYFPGYHASRRYFTNVNVSNTVVNTTIINNYYGNYSRGTINYGEIGYHNRTVAGAVVAVPAAAFVSARPVRTAAIAVGRDTFANARVMPVAAIAPTRQSLLGPSPRAARAPAPTVFNRPVVAATKPPPPVAPFAAREAALQKNPGRPLGMRELHSGTTIQQNAPPAGARSAAAATERANVKVVTRAGAPLRTPAAPIVPRGNAGNATRRNENAAERRGAGGPAAGGAPTEARTVNGREAGNRAGGNERATTGNAPGDRGERLPSSRFAHPSGPANERGSANAREGRGAANAGDNARTNVDRGARNERLQRETNAGPGPGRSENAQGNARRNASDEGQGNGRRGGNADNTPRGNADLRNERRPSEERTLRSGPPPANAPEGNGQGRGNLRSSAPERPQQNRPPETRNDNGRNFRTPPPQQEVQRAQPPPRREQPQYREPPPPQRVEQPQFRQPPQQRVEPPPQPQRQPPPQQQQQRGQSQNQGNDNNNRGGRHKKDDDKNGGGR